MRIYSSNTIYIIIECIFDYKDTDYMYVLYVGGSWKIDIFRWAFRASSNKGHARKMKRNELSLHMHATLNWDWNTKSFCERLWSGGYYWLFISPVNHPAMSNRLQTFGLGWTWYVLLQFPGAFFHKFAFEVECFTCPEHTLIRSFLEVFPPLKHRVRCSRANQTS